MCEVKCTTLDAILNAAKSEFLKKGFKSASLRNIVKTAGVTTGAFYGYFKSKEELFDALTGEQYDVFMGIFTETQNSFRELPPEVQMERKNGGQSAEGMRKMLDYAYEHKDVFKLILCILFSEKMFLLLFYHKFRMIEFLTHPAFNREFKMHSACF